MWLYKEFDFNNKRVNVNPFKGIANQYSIYKISDSI